MRATNHSPQPARWPRPTRWCGRGRTHMHAARRTGWVRCPDRGEPPALHDGPLGPPARPAEPIIPRLSHAPNRPIRSRVAWPVRRAVSSRCSRARSLASSARLPRTLVARSGGRRSCPPVRRPEPDARAAGGILDGQSAADLNVAICAQGYFSRVRTALFGLCIRAPQALSCLAGIVVH